MPRLRQRGMLVDDEAQAAHYQRVEVSLRTHWAHALAVHTGSCIAHRDPRLFNEHHDKLLAHVENVYGERSEVFLKRYLDRGEEPPIWALCEVLSLGQLSKWLSSIRHHRLRADIAAAYAIHEAPLCSFVRQLAFVRNVCAHHGRLWNRQLLVGTLMLPKKPQVLADQLQHAADGKDRIYNTLTLLAWLMRHVSPGSTWRGKMRRLLEERPDLWAGMGCPAGWNTFDIWRDEVAE